MDGATSQPSRSTEAPIVASIDQEAGQYAAAQVKWQQAIRNLTRKYSSLENLQKSEKVEALKNLNLDPRLIQNPYDALSNSFWRWKQMASTQGAALSEEARTKAAGNYYDKVIAPLYMRLGATPMPRDMWLQKAYTEALKYDTADSYHSSLFKGLVSGYASGMSTLDRVAGTSLNMLGSELKGAFTELAGYNALAHGDTATYYNAVRAANAGTQKSSNFFEKAKADAESIPWYGYIAKNVNNLSSNDQFWHDVVPTQGFTETATSTILEQAMQLPLYAGIGEAVKAVGLAGKAVPFIENLTNTLNATPAGRKVLPLLFASTEGAATGAALTAPGEDWEREAWQSAIGFGVGHAVFGVAGKLLGKAGDKVSAKLGDILEGPQKEEWHQRMQELLDGSQGKHIMSPQEERDAFKKVFSGYTSVMGKQGMLRVFDEALTHIGEEENHSPQQIADMRAALLKQDRAHWTPVLNVAASIQRLMGDGKFSELTEQNKNTLKYYFTKLIDEAGAEMPVHVPQVQEMVSKAAEKVERTPAAQSTIAKKAAQLQKADSARGLNQGKPQQFYLERAAAWYKEQNIKGAAKAAIERAKEPAEEVKNAAARRKDTPEPGKGTLKQRSQYYYDKAGKVIGYSLRLDKDYKVYATKAAKAEGFGNLKNWLHELSPEDFHDDLYDWFYPEDLAKGGFYFEHEGKAIKGRKATRGESTPSNKGHNPNFLAFMYNYKDHMPKELQNELRDRLLEEAEKKKYFSARIDDERQLRYYAIQMHNHVDDFLSALPQHKGEFNLFRSTQSDLLHPTKYQLELHEERMAEDRKNLQYMYQKQPEVLKNVLGVYDVLAAERYKLLKTSTKTKSISEEALANALRRQDINYAVGEQQLEGGKFESWRF